MVNFLGQALVLGFCFRALFEAAVGVLLWPVLCFLQKEKPGVSSQNTDFNRALVQRLEPVLEWFSPSPWAPWGCSQTIFAQPNPAARYPYTRREAVRMRDGVDIHLDWKEAPNMTDITPIVFVLHGIAGSSESKVSRNTTDLALEKGWRSVVYVRRGHGDSSLLPAAEASVATAAAEDVHVDVDNKPQKQPLTTQQAPSLAPGAPASAAGAGMEAASMKRLLSECKGFPMHCDVEDMAEVVEHMHNAFPKAPKLLVGFSAGANVVVKYLGENKANPFTAAVSVCNGHALVPLTHEFLKRPVANTLMASSLQGLLESRADDVRRIFDARGISLLDWRELQSTNNVRRFEEILLMPLNPLFKTVDEYYEYNSCHTAFQGVSIPLLTMATRDDPLIHPDLANHAINASKSNSNVISVTTKVGGHLGWLTGWSGRWWQQDVVFSFLDSVLAEQQAARTVTNPQAAQ